MSRRAHPTRFVVNRVLLFAPGFARRTAGCLAGTVHHARRNRKAALCVGERAASLCARRDHIGAHGRRAPARENAAVGEPHKAGTCVVLLYVDGNPYPNGSIDDFPPGSLEGIEVYRSASEIPADFRMPDSTRPEPKPASGRPRIVVSRKHLEVPSCCFCSARRSR